MFDRKIAFVYYSYFGMAETDEKQKKKAVATLKWKDLCLLKLLAFIAKIWARTLRFEIDAQVGADFSVQKSYAVVLWHNRLFVIGEYYRRILRHQSSGDMYGLVSTSKDGAWLVEFFRMMGIKAIRGSTSKRSMQALRDLLKVIKDGNSVGITPDGPRGPCYRFQEGPLLVIRKTNAALNVVGFEIPHAWRLKSWDGFYIPKPFSKIVIRTVNYDSFEDVIKHAEEGESPKDFLEKKLKEINPD